jgi:hypothetical protein
LQLGDALELNLERVLHIRKDMAPLIEHFDQGVMLRTRDRAGADFRDFPDFPTFGESTGHCSGSIQRLLGFVKGMIATSMRTSGFFEGGDTISKPMNRQKMLLN